MDIKITLDSKQLYPAVVNLKQFSSGTDVLTFLMEDYMYNTTDLSKMDCYAVCDMVNQEVDEVKLKTELVEGKLKITWTVDGYTTQLDGHITYQIVFKDIANEKAVLWFSHQGIIFISESHDGDGHIAAKYPTILQQWEQRMDDTDANASNILKQAQSGANTATQKANEASQSAKKAESEATDAKNSADKSEKMKDYIEELLNYEGTNAIEKEVVAARGEYQSLGNRIDNNENRLDTIEEQGVSVADTLPIGAQVMWDDKNELPDNWQYVEDDISDNRQLLINNDFQVNQRGKSSYTLNSNVELNYTLDMWAIYVEDDGSSITVTVEKDGVLIETKGTGKKQFFQTLTDKIQEYISNFTGVASFYVESISGNVVFEKWSYDDSNFEKIKEVTQGVNVGYIKNKNIGRIQFTFDGVCSLKLKYCDLFDGDVAYQHQMEDYTIALMRCKSKLKVFRFQPWSYIPCNLINKTNAVICLTDSVEMEKNKTVIISGNEPSNLVLHNTSDTTITKISNITNGSKSTLTMWCTLSKEVTPSTTNGSSFAVMSKEVIIIVSCEPL